MVMSIIMYFMEAKEIQFCLKMTPLSLAFYQVCSIQVYWGTFGNLRKALSHRMLNGYNLQAQGTEAHKFFASYHKLLSQLECYTLNRTQVRVTFLSGTTITVYKNNILWVNGKAVWLEGTFYGNYFRTKN